jgi:hypothetical protein
MFPWKTVGMHDPSSASHASCVPRFKGGRVPLRNYKKGPDDLLLNFVFFSTFEELTLPIKGPMEGRGARVVKLYEPSPTPCLYVAQAENMVGRVPLIPLFLAGNATPTIRIQASLWGALMHQRGMAGAAAMSMRSTRGFWARKATPGWSYGCGDCRKAGR